MAQDFLSKDYIASIPYIYGALIQWNNLVAIQILAF